MQQHEHHAGRRPVPALPSRRPRVRLALTTAAAATLTGTLLSATAGTATAADGTHAPRADFNGDGIGDMVVGSFENDGNGAVPYLPSVSPSTSGVSTTGYPNLGG
ncbi:hypothetical protein [Streptomyces sp. NPDC007929]|uniref:hypothetical protein n=1 Tax=unclassified Streptomyces TaxID=2593676 RepID=UPI0036E2519D